MAQRAKPKALGGGGTGLGLLWGAYSTVTTAKDIPEDAGWIAKMIVDPPIYLPWLVAAIGIVVVIWAFFWPSEDRSHDVSGTFTAGDSSPITHQSYTGGERNINAASIGQVNQYFGQPPSAPKIKRPMRIRNAALDSISGINEARPDFPLKDLVALIAPAFGDAPEGRNERRDWVRRINLEIADFVNEKDLSVWARWRDLPRKEIHYTILEIAKFDHLKEQFTAFLPTDSEPSIYTDVMFNQFEVDRALNA